MLRPHLRRPGSSAAIPKRPPLRGARTWIASLALLLLPLVGGRALAAGAARHAFYGFGPSQLMRAYNFDPLYQRGLSGTGQTLAFIEVDGFDRGDLATFNRTYGLPQIQPTVYLPPGATLHDMPPAEGETTMDLEYAHALAPGARLQVYEVLNAGDFRGYATGLADALNAAAANGAMIISMSLRATGSFFCSQLHAALRMHTTLEHLSAKGISIFAASGDYGASPCQTHPLHVGTVYPAADPGVTAVGGTHLSLTRSGTYGSETAWVGS